MSPSQGRVRLALRPEWPSWIAALAPHDLMKVARRVNPGMNASSQRPRSPTVPQPLRRTFVDSTKTRPAPPAAYRPAFMRCQSVACPFTAEYWCIGEITTRLRSVRSLIWRGANRVTISSQFFLRAQVTEHPAALATSSRAASIPARRSQAEESRLKAPSEDWLLTSQPILDR